MNDFKGIKITYETESGTTTWQSPYSDVTIDDILWGFYGLCVGQTWCPTPVISGMREFAKDHADNCTITNPESVTDYFNNNEQ